MSKWLTVGLVAVASLATAGVSLADVPSGLTSIVTCECTADAGTGSGASSQYPYRCTIGPSGVGPADDINVRVDVRNVLGAVLANSNVVVTANALNGAAFIWDNDATPVGDPLENPQSKLSDALGNADFVFDEGGIDQAVPTTYPNLDFGVTAQGPGPGGPVGLNACGVAGQQLRVNAFDMDKNCLVDLSDFAIFTAAYIVTGDPEGDFNWDGVVDLIDFALFTPHYLSADNCNKQ